VTPVRKRGAAAGNPAQTEAAGAADLMLAVGLRASPRRNLVIRAWPNRLPAGLLSRNIL
jgi:hypothetical protein